MAARHFNEMVAMLVPFAHMPTRFEIADTDVKRKPRMHHINALGVLDSASLRIATTLSLPHHKSAGGADDFI